MKKKLNFLKFFVFVFSLIQIFTLKAFATQFDLNVFYVSDTISSTNSPSAGLSNYDFAILMNSEGRSPMGIGWSYALTSLKEDSGVSGNTPLTYSSTETGPKFSIQLGKEQNWHLALVYNLTAKAKFEDANGNAEWRGTSIKTEFGYMAKIASKAVMGVKFNYHSASYNEQITNSTTLTTTTNKRTSIYPSLAFTVMF